MSFRDTFSKSRPSSIGITSGNVTCAHSFSSDLISFIHSKTEKNHRANWIFTFPFLKASQGFTPQQKQVLFFSHFPNSRKTTNRALCRERRGLITGTDCRAWLPDQTLGGLTSQKMKNTPKKKTDFFSWLRKDRNLGSSAQGRVNGLHKEQSSAVPN